MLGRLQQPHHISYNFDQTLAPGQTTTSTTGGMAGPPLLRANSFRFTFTPTNHIPSNHHHQQQQQKHHHYYSNNANSGHMINQRLNNNQSTATKKTLVSAGSIVEEGSIVELE